MGIEFLEFSNDVEKLVDFLTGETWTYFGTPNPNGDRIRAAYKGYYEGEGIKSFWVKVDGSHIGLIRLYDLDDGTPMFDLRLSEKARKKGYGTKSLKWIVDYVFNNYKEIDRIEGDTRVDNIGMRSVFQKCGFLKESHHRNAWVCRNGEVYDSVGYGIIRSDWEKGEITPLEWDDLK